MTIESDERWSFVGLKAYQQGIGLATDRPTQEIVGVAIGDRAEKTAQQFWHSLPGVSRQCAVSYTDFWAA